MQPQALPQEKSPPPFRAGGSLSVVSVVESPHFTMTLSNEFCLLVVTAHQIKNLAVTAVSCRACEPKAHDVSCDGCGDKVTFQNQLAHFISSLFGAFCPCEIHSSQIKSSCQPLHATFLDFFVSTLLSLVSTLSLRKGGTRSR